LELTIVSQIWNGVEAASRENLAERGTTFSGDIVRRGVPLLALKFDGEIARLQRAVNQTQVGWNTVLR
jgi:hypothetical protein